MTTHERMTRMLNHQEADRVPITDSPWGPTLDRWRKEGLPADVPWDRYFDLDRFAGIGADNSPRYPTRVIEDTDEYSVTFTNWGATIKSWAHAKGIKVELHSCGDVRPIIPDLIDLGIDMLNPLEVKAGMDPRWLKQTYGAKLAFHGGLNAALFWEPAKLDAQMREVIPVMKQRGGYVLGSDHSVPDSVSLEDFRRFVDLAKELGRYG